jgi:hypothetical protein
MQIKVGTAGIFSALHWVDGHTLRLRRERVQLLSMLAAERIAAARKRVLKSFLIESQKMSVDLISGPLDSAATGCLLWKGFGVSE